MFLKLLNRYTLSVLSTIWKYDIQRNCFLSILSNCDCKTEAEDMSCMRHSTRVQGLRVKCFALLNDNFSDLIRVRIVKEEKDVRSPVEDVFESCKAQKTLNI